MQYNSTNRLSKDDVSKIHPNLNQITEASFTIINNVVKFNFVGDVYAMQFEYNGTGIAERLISYDWQIINRNNKGIIFTTKKNISLPSEIFKIRGEFNLFNVYCADVYGNSVYAYGQKLKSETDIVNSNLDIIHTSKTGFIQDKSTFGKSMFTSKRKATIVAKSTFKDNQIKAFSKTRQEMLEKKQAIGNTIDLTKYDRAKKVLADSLVMKKINFNIKNAYINLNDVSTAIDIIFEYKIDNANVILDNALILSKEENIYIEEAVIATTEAVDSYWTNEVVEYITYKENKRSKKYG